ncbi:sugar phosphate isomerase/epimerase [Halarchaeum sp. CBA1220]|uniref:sugar phosphate isomerase/epimerase family protein n=1 Tax=Halarchaeum sp. CBA1220 TaxID=1853682 RepID=UPI000F3A8576|nr:TIM barrel protein [Halarchaeum sp. CBA1220]QLC32841.1 sugar phosphate isomerase/epimerase [Halarchaeum sp. CBA1220]
MRDYDVAVQTVVYQDYDLDGLLAELAGTPVDTVELWGAHLSPADDETTIEAGEAALAEAGVSVCGYGVADLEGTGEAEAHVAFADRLGADYVTVNYPPVRDDITEALCDLGETYGVDVAIHNYSGVHHDDLDAVFSSVADVRDVLERHDHPRLGVCVDTGHFLVMDEAPEEVVPALGERIRAVHLKDTSEAEIEDAPGAGVLDLREFVGLLDEHAALEEPLVVEYELDENVTAELVEAYERIRAAMA